jgi:hypothetical protein
MRLVEEILTSRIVNFIVSARTHDVFERRQRLLQLAAEKIEALRLGDADEVFYAALRESLLAAGATDADIDALADYLARGVVEWTADDPDERHSQLELLGRHLARTDMDVHIRNNVTVLRIDFPSRPTVQ